MSVTSVESVVGGGLPPVGEVPAEMTALAIRSDRLGDPTQAFQLETLPVPSPGPGQVLVGVMAAGVNFNNVWAAKGLPIDVIKVRQKKGQPEDFHIGGSDASGIVYATGDDVEGISVGDEVVIHPGVWDPQDPWVVAGRDPMLAPSSGIWGYDTNYGAFAQFSLCQAHQVMPKASHLTWEEAAAPTLVGTTAYRMLFGWEGHTLEPGDVVLVWGGSGGLGSQAIQLVADGGGIPVAVTSSQEAGDYCVSLGAKGWIDRNEFDHWGIPPHWKDNAGQREWTGAAREFGKRIWDIVGERKNPRIVFEHPGEATIPTSMFVCDDGGMVVICAGTTGYSSTVDLRYLWTRQKRFQGSHGTNDVEAYAFNDLVRERRIDPCLGATVGLQDLPQVHQDMWDGKLSFGNTVALVGAEAPGLGAS